MATAAEYLNFMRGRYEDKYRNDSHPEIATAYMLEIDAKWVKELFSLNSQEIAAATLDEEIAYLNTAVSAIGTI